MTYKLYIKLVDTDALELYQKNIGNLDSNTDSGFDLFTNNDTSLDLHQTKLVDTGIQCKMVKIEYYGRELIETPSGFYMYPRSSIYKTPLILHNSVGIIDSGYRGNIKLPMCYFKPVNSSQGVSNLNTQQYTIKKHTRLVKICAPDLSPFKVELVSELDTTERGEGGFGSTGI